MDKEDHVNLDVEFNQYLQTLRPYLGQLLNEEDVKICNSWIQKLSDCKEDKNLRNRYIFSLCFQLAKGVLSPPFNNYPPSEDLPMMCDKFNSDESYSDLETHIMYFKNGNSEKFIKSKSSSKSICQAKNSDITICSSKTGIDDNEICDVKTFTRDFLSSSNSTLANCFQCPEIVNDLKKYVRSEDNVYLRVNNLVEKLREIKTQNTILNKEIQLLKEKSEIKKSLDSPSSNNKLQIHCAINTDSFINDSMDLLHHCIYETKLIELKRKFEEFNELKRIDLEELKSKHEKDIANAKIFIRREIQDKYEKQMQDLKETFESKISHLNQSADNEISQLKICLEGFKSDKESLIAAKNQVIDDYRTELDEIKAQNFILRNKFIRANNGINLESIKEKSFQLERRLYKTEKSKNKRIKAYQMQLTNLQREKNVLNATMHLQLLKQRSELVLDLTEENQKELISSFGKLEEKYKEVVANVQAAAIQRKIQDQMSLDAVVKAVYDSSDDLNVSSLDNQDEFQSEQMRSKQKTKNCKFSPMLCKNNEHIGKNFINIEDNFVPGFCLDEVKLSELFERVYITRNKTTGGQLNN